MNPCSMPLAAAAVVLVATLGPAADAAGTPPPERPFDQVLDVGPTGFDIHRPVLAAACAHGCPWGELGDFVREAMASDGYDVVLCRNCNRDRGPGLVAGRHRPPPLDAVDRFVGTTFRIDAPVDFGITAADNLVYAYRGTHEYADSGPYRNLRLIAHIDDPRYLMVAVTADSGITDLDQIRKRRLAVRLMARPDRPAVRAVLDYYGLDPRQVASWGGSFTRPSMANLDAHFDVIIDSNASPAENPEAAYWSAYTWKHDLRFLQLPDALLARLAATDDTLEPVTARWGLLRGVDRDIRTVMRNGHVIFARDDLADETAYRIARAIYQRRGKLDEFIRPYSYDPRHVFADHGVPLHPGAERFYRDAGLLHTPECVPDLEAMPDGGQRYRAAGWDGPTGDQMDAEYRIHCTALGHAYTTTVDVVRPRDAARFSGVVVVEPTHPGNLWPVRSTVAAYLAAAGHASVAVNSSAVVVERLVKPVDPRRYADLLVPDADDVESEILHQVAIAIARGGLGAAPAPRLVLAGYSNTGARVRSYIGYLRRAGYAGVFDGYLVGQTAVGTRPGPLPDLDVPVIDLEGEREIVATLQRNPDGLTYRRPDTALFRLYEVPGMAHLDTSDPARLAFPPSWCGIDTPSSFPVRQIWSNTLDRLVQWITQAHPAPHGQRIQLTKDGAGIARDADGNARGGVPTPQLLVPVAAMHTTSQNEPDHPRARCDMIGPELRFGPERLRTLYGSYDGYLRRLEAVLDRLIDDGWYLPQYRDEVLARARQRAGWFERSR